ncbi:MAG: CapA family protein, partial [Anaerolineales bacterium]
SFENLERAWRGEAAGALPKGALLMDESTLYSMSALWGQPAAQAVEVLPSGELLAQAWSRRAWAILPFEALEPRWKVLEVDGGSPIRKDFNPQAYPLSVPVSLTGDPVLAETIRTVYGDTMVPTTNRDPGRMTVLVMTGVTAMVRGTAFAMERKGVEYPGLDVGAWLREADLTHISNEVPFAQDCPYPDPFQAEMRFCSDPRYIGLLESIGADIIELTGDHFQDWGAAAMKLTLKMYQERGWLYFGGGENLEEGRRALIVEHNGNRLAFIGCNAKGGSFAQASANHPGAAPCHAGWMSGEIARLRESGYLPIATFQHFEYYTYQAQPNQKSDFKQMAAAGAVIVSGSQAHQPQALEFHKGALIHYGLGNLFFDQYDVSAATRQAFIDRHVFYNGCHISTELLPAVFLDYARPRPMTAQEAGELLEAVFTASGW